MPADTSFKDWFYPFLGGMGIGGLFILLNLLEGTLPRNVTWANILLFCVMIALGFTFTATSLVQWEDRKKQMNPSTLTSPGWLLGEWVLITLWMTAVLSFSMSAATFFYSGEWFVLAMLAIFGPMSALLATFFVSRNKSLQRENDRWKET